MRDYKAMAKSLTPEQMQGMLDHINKADGQITSQHLREYLDTLPNPIYKDPNLDERIASNPVAQVVGKGVGAVKDFAHEHPVITGLGTTAAVLGGLYATGGLPAIGGAIIPGAAGMAVDKLAPEGPSLADRFPETAKTLHLNPSVRDAAALLAAEGTGRFSSYVGSKLQNFGEKGILNNAIKNAPTLPPGADRDMTSMIMDRNYLPIHDDASYALADTMMNLGRKGRASSGNAKGVTDLQDLSISPERIEQLHSFFPDHPAVQDLKARLDASRAKEITPDFVQSEPAYSKTVETHNPGGVTQSKPEQSDLFDEGYYAAPDAHSKPVPEDVRIEPDYVTPAGDEHMMPRAPYGPEIQKPIEPELGGNSTNIPPSVEFNTTNYPPKGHYDIKPDSLYDLYSHANSNRHNSWKGSPITGQPMAKDAEFGKMMNGLRSDLRTSENPLTPEQDEMLSSFLPGHGAKTEGEAVKAMQGYTTQSIKDQQSLKGPSIHDNSLALMQRAYGNPDTRAFAQRLTRDYGLPDIENFSSQYGKSQDAAKDLIKYLSGDTTGNSELSDAMHHFGQSVVYGGGSVAMPAARLTGAMLNGSKGYQAASKVGDLLQRGSKNVPSEVINNVYSKWKGVPDGEE